jgi:aminopeptidase C
MPDRRQESLKFETRIAQMEERLATRNVAIEKKDYAAEAFGSWQIVAGTEQKKFDFSYDGKDSYLMYRDAAVVPKDFHDFQHKRFRTWEGEDPLSYVEEVLMREFPA